MAYDFDESDTFLDPDVFGEKVIFAPRTGSNRGIAREIYAVVDRRHLHRFGPGGRAEIAPEIHIWIANDSIKGSDTIDTGGDTIKVARTQGRAAEVQQIAEIVGDSTPAIWHIRLR